MFLEDYQTLEELLDEFRQEDAEIDIQIEYNMRCIRKAEVILREFKDSETEDYKVFSPRKAEVVHKQEIEQAYSEKSAYEEKNRELYRKKDLLGRRIYKLDQILKKQNPDLLLTEEEQRERIDDSKDELHLRSLNELNDIMKKIEAGSRCLEKNHGIQAKQELVIAKRYLNDFIERYQ